MAHPYDEAWAELDEIDRSNGLEPIKQKVQCNSLIGKPCSIRKPCSWCKEQERLDRIEDERLALESLL